MPPKVGKTPLITTPVRHAFFNILLNLCKCLIYLVAEGGIEPPTQRFSVAHLYSNLLKKQHYYKLDDPYKCIIMAMCVMFSRAEVAHGFFLNSEEICSCLLSYVLLKTE
ncbi:MAG: hypothetical protein WAZ26_03205 [Candidatus Rickettsiella isopodorum]